MLVLRERNRLEVLEVTKRKISIKTIDGGRFDFTRNGTEPVFDGKDGTWGIINQDGVKRMFMLKNIVSITDKETENE